MQAAANRPGVVDRQLAENYRQELFTAFLTGEAEKRKKEEAEEKRYEGAKRMRGGLMEAYDRTKYRTPVMERNAYRAHILSMSLFPNIYDRKTLQLHG